jgi:hypothetical protein
MIQIMPYRQRINTTRPINKENMPSKLGIVPPELEEALVQKVVRVNQSPTTSMRGKWISESLEEAMEVEQGTCSLWGAN